MELSLSTRPSLCSFDICINVRLLKSVLDMSTQASDVALTIEDHNCKKMLILLWSSVDHENCARPGCLFNNGQRRPVVVCNTRSGFHLLRECIILAQDPKPAFLNFILHSNTPLKFTNIPEHPLMRVARSLSGGLILHVLDTTLLNGWSRFPCWLTLILHYEPYAVADVICNYETQLRLWLLRSWVLAFTESVTC
jgi:hypothetical protein